MNNPDKNPGGVTEGGIYVPATSALSSQAPVVSYVTNTRWPDLDPEWVKLVPNGTNHGTFSDQIQYILAPLNLITKKTEFVPSGGFLTHFGPIFSPPVMQPSARVTRCSLTK